MSSDAVAASSRKGRLKQRYDNEFRLVAGSGVCLFDFPRSWIHWCVPYRVNKKDDEGGNPCSSLGDDTAAEVEVLMISTPNRADMVFPKGGWEDDEDVYQAACRETTEEAGVKGIINRAALGHWVFKSKSSQNSTTSTSGACKGYIFGMEVTEELESWPEQDTHDRRWVSPAEAYQLCRYDWMREALTALLERLSVLQPVAAAAAAATPELAADQSGMYMMLQASSDGGAVALC
ncbi:nudix hydrolase 13 mitochondrial isoform X1 [Zea mays]|uniref:nudix hydrolase 13 mitochondrial isoform X1 n=1 Tax=Zea mays TaxID=4577 RepID=UPI0004DE8CA2|nr:nudix hydrolase 13 mitochondrial isoform X1 [Zea mays]|eukprot:XP_008676572.1 nudix hydrolase 13 mitochondrial isoform X1 [Zea mays]